MTTLDQQGFGNGPANARTGAGDNSAQIDQELEERLVSMVAPVTDSVGNTVAALNISGQANRSSAKGFANDVLSTLLRWCRSSVLQKSPGR